MNATLFIRLGLVAAVVACGHYYAEFRVQKVQKEWQILNTRVVQELMAENKSKRAKDNAVAAENLRQAERARTEIESLQSRLRQKVADSPAPVDTDFHIGLFIEAIRDPNLPETRIPPFVIGEAGEAAYTLYSIGEYNACARQLNALIDAISD